MVLFQCCSITPRYHSLGYHVEWKRVQHQRAKNERNDPDRRIGMIVDQSNRNRVQPEAIHTNKNQSSSIRDNGINPAEHFPLRAETSLGNGIYPPRSIPIHKQDLASKNSPIGLHDNMNNIGRKTRNPDHVNKIHQRISPPRIAPQASFFYYSVSLRPFSVMTVTEEAEVVGVAAGEVIFTSTGQFFLRLLRL